MTSLNLSLVKKIMFTSCFNKQLHVKALFQDCLNEEAKYKKIIELGRQQPPLDAQHQVPDNLVKGCQSTMYLHSQSHGKDISFSASADALISSGLAALLIIVYSGESPETILKCPPHFLEDLGINASLTPSRANGLYSIHLKMKQDALKFLLIQNSQGISSKGYKNV